MLHTPPHDRKTQAKTSSRTMENLSERGKLATHHTSKRPTKYHDKPKHRSPNFKPPRTLPE